MAHQIEEGKDETKRDILDVDSQIAMKQSLIESVLGKEDANMLFDGINKEPQKYIDDPRKMVKELANLVLSKSTKNMSTQDLYVLIKTLQTQVSDLRSKAEGRKWKHVGSLNNLEELVKKYSVLEHEYGIQHNAILGCVHPIQFNSWDRGTRVSTVHSYPMGDNAKSLKWGRSVFTKGLDDCDEKSKWYHHYIYNDSDKYYASNGVVNSQIFVRLL